MNKILLVKLSALGDVIFNIPLANTLKENGYEVHWLTTEKGIDLIENNPCSDKTFLLPLYSMRKNFHIKYIFQIIKLIIDLRKEKYDIAFDCQRRLKSMPFMLFSGAKRRIISHHSTEYAFLGANEIMPEDKSNLHMVKFNQKYAEYLGLSTDKVKFTLPEESQEIKNKINQYLNCIDVNKPKVVIAPATTWDAKHWNKENWKQIVEYLKDKCNLIFTGTENDKSLISEIGGDEFINLAGKTNLKEMIELFRNVDLVISPDSGSAHLAWACSQPALIEIFCCTNTRHFGCFGNDEKYITIVGNASCRPCNRRKCPKETDKNICTKTPLPEDVIKVINTILNL